MDDFLWGFKVGKKIENSFVSFPILIKSLISFLVLLYCLEITNNKKERNHDDFKHPYLIFDFS